jgi:hypothetical protein
MLRPESNDSRNHSGFYVAARPWVRYLVLLLLARSWSYVVDDDHFTKPFGEQVLSFQIKYGLGADREVGPETWAVLHEAP